MMLKFLLSALLVTTSVFAEEAKVETPELQKAGSQYAGLSLGIAKPAGSNINTTPLRFAYAVEYTYALIPQLAAGLFASRNDGEAAKDSIIDFTITRLGAQVVYTPAYDTYFTLKGGIGLLEYSGSLNLGGGTNLKITSDAEAFFVAPGFGIIFPVTEKIAFIPNLSYTFFFKNSEVESFQVFDAVGTFRYQF